MTSLSGSATPRYLLSFIVLLLLHCIGSSGAWILSSRKATLVSLSASNNGKDNDNRLPLPVRLDSVNRVYCLSDLHTDHPDNQKWLQEKLAFHNFDLESDLIIVAGDISHDMETFGKSLAALAAHAQVLFVPGNHEAWINRRHKPHSTSFDKLQEVYQECHKWGVHTKPLLIGATSSPHPLWILPLESWYDGTLSFREALCHDFHHWPWADFKRCNWTDRFPPVSIGKDKQQPPNNPGLLPVGLVEYFLEQNEPLLQQSPFPLERLDPPETTGIMTVSHFLPNSQSLPDWKQLDEPEFQDKWFDHGAGGMSAKFAKVAGSSLLDDQIRRLLPPPQNSDNTQQKQRNIHIFGHSHRPKDFYYKGIRYIHNPLGKPRERQLHMVAPKVDFQLVWDTHQGGEVPGETVLRYWEEQGGGLEALERRLKELRPKGRYNKFKGSSYNSTKMEATRESRASSK